MMDIHTQLSEPLAAYVLEACDGDEASAVEAHLRECVACEAEAVRLRSAASWIGAEQVTPPPARLRHAVLSRAREVRRPSPFRTLTEAYAGQVRRLEKVLATLGPDDWRRPDPRHGDLAGMVAHLAGNDALVVADLGLRPIPAPDRTGAALWEAWRSQAETLVQGLVRDDGADLTRPARLTGRGEPRPAVLRDALIQRAFETWTHLDDVGAMVGRPQPAPPPEQLRRIVDLAVDLLPEALRHHGVEHPAAGRLVLTGAGGGEWTFPLGHAGTPEAPVALTIGTSAVGFARLVANRHTPETLQHTVTGDRALATQLLRIASTLGCD